MRLFIRKTAELSSKRENTHSKDKKMKNNINPSLASHGNGIDSRIIYAFYYSTFALIMSFLLWKCRFGLAATDEAFYLTIPYSMTKGDLLFLHEWHLSQLLGVVLYPLLRLYLRIFGNTEGIILRFRILFTVVWGITAWFYYKRLKPYSLIGAMLASLVFLIYTPWGIMALCYNSLGLLFALNAAIILITAQKYRKVQCAVSGVNLAGAVLCCPSLIIAFMIWSITVILRNKRGTKSALTERWLYLSIGAASVFILFCVFILQDTTIHDILKMLPYMMKDPEHKPLSFVQSSMEYFRILATANRFFPFACALLLADIIAVKRTKSTSAGFVAVCVVILAVQFFFWFERRHINYLMLPVSLMGVYCMACSDDCKIHELFWYVWMPGLAYTYCANLTSNRGLLVISSVSTIMTVSSIVMGLLFLDGRQAMPGKYRMAAIAFTVVMVFQIGLQFKIRYDRVFWEQRGMSDLTEEIKGGPNAGILTSPENAEQYQTMCNDIEEMKTAGDWEKVLFLSTYTYPYLAAQESFATYSAWLSGVSKTTIRRLDEYYKLWPEKLPDLIYIEDKNEKYADHYVRSGYSITKTTAGNLALFRDRR